eukprot:EG_transcript_28035
MCLRKCEKDTVWGTLRGTGLGLIGQQQGWLLGLGGQLDVGGEAEHLAIMFAAPQRTYHFCAARRLRSWSCLSTRPSISVSMEFPVRGSWSSVVFPGSAAASAAAPSAPTFVYFSWRVTSVWFSRRASAKCWAPPSPMELKFRSIVCNAVF